MAIYSMWAEEAVTIKIIINGEAVELPSGGMTQAEADGRYLQLSGGSTEGFTLKAKGLDSAAQLSMDSTFGTVTLSSIAYGPPMPDSDEPDIMSYTEISLDPIGEVLIKLGEVAQITINDMGIEGINADGEEFSVNPYRSVLHCISPTDDNMPATKGYVDEAIAGLVSGQGVKTIKPVTQAEFDALTAKDASTLYLIKEGA